jgi:transcription initiation factor TFIID subunit 5
MLTSIQFELFAVSYPIFAHTYLDLIDFGFMDTAIKFFEDNAENHRLYHPSELGYLAGIRAPHQILLDPYAHRLR